MMQFTGALHYYCALAIPNPSYSGAARSQQKNVLIIETISRARCSSDTLHIVRIFSVHQHLNLLAETLRRPIPCRYAYLACTTAAYCSHHLVSKAVAQQRSRILAYRAVRTQASCFRTEEAGRQSRRCSRLLSKMHRSSSPHRRSPASWRARRACSCIEAATLRKELHRWVDEIDAKTVPSLI